MANSKTETAKAGYPRLAAVWKDVESWAARNPVAASIASFAIGALLSPVAYYNGLKTTVTNEVITQALKEGYATKKDLEYSDIGGKKSLEEVEGKVRVFGAMERRQSGADALRILETIDRDGALERRAVRVQIFELQGGGEQEFVDLIASDKERPVLQSRPQPWKSAEETTKVIRPSKLGPNESKLLIIGPGVSFRLGCQILTLVRDFPHLDGVAVNRWGDFDSGAFDVALGYPDTSWKGERTSLPEASDLCGKLPKCSQPSNNRQGCEVPNCESTFGAALDGRCTPTPGSTVTPTPSP